MSALKSLLPRLPEIKKGNTELRQNRFVMDAVQRELMVEALEEAKALLEQSEAELSWADEGSSSRELRARIREALGQ